MENLNLEMYKELLQCNTKKKKNRKDWQRWAGEMAQQLKELASL